MIGWWIIVSTQTPEERDRADQDTRRAAILAQWEAGAEGICNGSRLKTGVLAFDAAFGSN